MTKDGKTSSGETSLEYPYPQEFIDSMLDLDVYLDWQKNTVARNGNLANVPARFERRTGIYKFYSEDDLLHLGANWLPGHENLLRLHSAHAYAAFMHSTDAWDMLNDRKMNLRKGLRTLKGGLLIANNGMTQGEYLVIPLTSSIGYQKQCHVVVHLTNADPDLGRKGFQPEVRELCEEVAKRIINSSLKKHRDRLKPNSQSTSDDERERDLGD